MPEQLTDDALRAKGLAVLEDHLGPVHTLRFLALMRRESFDYQSWQQQHFGALGSLSRLSYSRKGHKPHACARQRPIWQLYAEGTG